MKEIHLAFTIVDGHVVLYFLHHQSETSKSFILKNAEH